MLIVKLVYISFFGNYISSLNSSNFLTNKEIINNTYDLMSLESFVINLEETEILTKIITLLELSDKDMEEIRSKLKDAKYKSLFIAIDEVEVLKKNHVYNNNELNQIYLSANFDENCMISKGDNLTLLKLYYVWGKVWHHMILTLPKTHFILAGNGAYLPEMDKGYNSQKAPSAIKNIDLNPLSSESIIDILEHKDESFGTQYMNNMIKNGDNRQTNKFYDYSNDFINRVYLLTAGHPLYVSVVFSLAHNMISEMGKSPNTQNSIDIESCINDLYSQMKNNQTIQISIKNYITSMKSITDGNIKELLIYLYLKNNDKLISPKTLISIGHHRNATVENILLQYGIPYMNVTDSNNVQGIRTIIPEIHRNETINVIMSYMFKINDFSSTLKDYEFLYEVAINLQYHLYKKDFTKTLPFLLGFDNLYYDIPERNYWYDSFIENKISQESSAEYIKGLVNQPYNTVIFHRHQCSITDILLVSKLITNVIDIENKIKQMPIYTFWQCKIESSSVDGIDIIKEISKVYNLIQELDMCEITSGSF